MSYAYTFYIITILIIYVKMAIKKCKYKMIWKNCLKYVIDHMYDFINHPKILKTNCNTKAKIGF